jgi:hypothetical protein
MIYHTFDAQGGFVAGDPDTGVTVYAYPTSVCVNCARRNPVKTAREMIDSEPMWRGRFAAEYDEQNWKLLRRDHIVPPGTGWVIRPGNGINPTRNTEE